MAVEGSDPKKREEGAPSGAVSDRLWPVLLDRLTDLEPDHKKESLQARVLSRKAYRDGVLRDLQWLLNATNLDASIDFSPYPDAARSVVNFGLPSLAGRLASNVDRSELEAAIRRGIIEFEPRILPNSIQVQVTSGNNMLDVHNVLSVTIRGELWSMPYPLEILLRSDIDLETGQVVLHYQSQGT
jgi:type VI secretion system protein ImpF